MGLAFVYPDDYRYERKFLAPASYRHVRAVLMMLPAHFRQAYPPRFINNVYFDTIGMSDYHAHVNGANQRSKLRVRWYGDAGGRIEVPTLEVKVKRGLVGVKPAFRLPAFDFDGAFPANLQRDLAESEALPEVVRQRWARCRPSLFNRYHRRYYVSVDGRFRVTLDTGLTFRAVRGRPYGPRARHVEREQVLIEMKYAREHDGDAERVSSALPFRLDKLSKYVRGVQVLRHFHE